MGNGKRVEKDCQGSIRFLVFKGSHTSLQKHWIQYKAMKSNQWTVALAVAGIVSASGTTIAEEAMNPISAFTGGTTISGYVSTSAHWDLGSGNNNPPAYAYKANKADGFNLDVVGVSLNKPLGEGQWSSGYRADLLFGPDANALGTQSLGNSSDVGIRQAYVALGIPVGNGIEVKAGVFDSILGFESFGPTENAHYTRSYGYTIQPTTHTGVLGSYEICEGFSVMAGIANTVSPMINGRAGVAGNPRAESYKAYMAGFTMVLPESMGFLAGTTFYGGVVNGFNSMTLANTTVASFNQTSWSIGSTMEPGVEGLKLGIAYDYVGIHDGDGNSFGTDAFANAASMYGSFQASEKVSLHLRGEYASRSSMSQIIAGGPSGALNSSFFPGFMPSRVVDVTGTLQYDLFENVISRLEFRWDRALDGDNHFAGQPAFVGGPGPSKRNAYLVAMNFVYQF